MSLQKSHISTHNFHNSWERSLDSSVSMVARLQVGQLKNRGSIPARDKTLISSPSCPNRLWGLSSLLFNGYRGKVAGCWSWPLTSSSGEVKNEWIYTSAPLYYAFMNCTGRILPTCEVIEWGYSIFELSFPNIVVSELIINIVMLSPNIN